MYGQDMILRRQEDSWWIQMDGQEIRLDLPASALAIEAVELVRARYSYTRLGVCAKDIGPAAAGHGDIIWLRR